MIRKMILTAGKALRYLLCQNLTYTKMSKSHQQFRVTLTPVRTRKAKVIQPHRVTDQRVSEFEKKLLDLISDPTSQYLAKREVFTKTLVNALHEVQLGLVVS